MENGELDTGLLAIASDQVSYKTIPSLMDGKYVYVSRDPNIRNILELLFSDQSPLAYINETLRADNAARLSIGSQVAYDDFAAYQQPRIDYLIQHGVLKNTGKRVRLANARQFRVLKDLFQCEAASYYHYPAEARAAIDAMVA